MTRILAWSSSRHAGEWRLIRLDGELITAADTLREGVARMVDLLDADESMRHDTGTDAPVEHPALVDEWNDGADTQAGRKQGIHVRIARETDALSAVAMVVHERSTTCRE